MTFPHRARFSNEEHEALDIEILRRYNEAVKGSTAESPEMVRLVAEYDGKPITPLQYWIRRAMDSEDKAEKYKAVTRKTPVFAMSMMFAAGFITGSFAVVIAYFM